MSDVLRFGADPVDACEDDRLPAVESQHACHAFCRRWMRRHGIRLVVVPAMIPQRREFPFPIRQFQVTLQRGAAATRMYYAQLSHARWRGRPTALELMMALAWETQFLTIAEAVRYGFSRAHARRLTRFARKVRRVVPSRALDELRAFRARVYPAWTAPRRT